MLLARELLRDPYWPLRAARELGTRYRGRHSICARRRPARRRVLEVFSRLRDAFITRSGVAMSYGSSVTLAQAKQVAAPALAEAAKNQWAMAVAIVDTAGPAGLLREDGRHAERQRAACALEKARSAALFKRPTKAFQDMLAAGGEGLRVLAHARRDSAWKAACRSSSTATIVGAIGVSGGTSPQDGQCAQAGAAALGEDVTEQSVRRSPGSR